MTHPKTNRKTISVNLGSGFCRVMRQLAAPFCICMCGLVSLFVLYLWVQKR